MKKRTRVCRGNERGFTLVELIIAIAIMATLAGLVTLSVVRYIRKARAGRATEEARTIVMAVQNGLASDKNSDVDMLLDKQFVRSDGSVTDCGVINNWMLSKAQNNVVVADTDPDYIDYLIAKEILENLNAGENNQYRFFRFKGSESNPVGMNCKTFTGQYNCPGVIIVYNPNGEVTYMEYYNYGCLIRYEDDEYVLSESETFVGNDRIKY